MFFKNEQEIKEGLKKVKLAFKDVCFYYNDR